LQDQYLDERLAQIRAAEAAGHLTIREAADARVAALMTSAGEAKVQLCTGAAQ
jgi:hypothetical protein